MSNFTHFVTTFKAGTGVYNTQNLGGLLMKEANLEDLTYALSRYFVDSMVTTEQSIPPQVEYAKIVNDGLTQLDFFKVVAQNMFRLTSYGKSEFGKFTVYSTIESFSRVTKEEFTNNKGYYLHRSVLEQQLSKIQPLELIRAMRLALQKLVFRFFHTYDVNEMREIGNKQVKVCDAASATFRRGEHNITTEEFCDFVELLIDTCRIMNTYSAELTEFRDVFLNAARTAKQMREAYVAEHPRPKQKQGSQQRQHNGSQNYSQQQKGQPRFKPQGRFAQPNQPNQPNQSNHQNQVTQ